MNILDNETESESHLQHEATNRKNSITSRNLEQGPGNVLEIGKKHLVNNNNKMYIIYIKNNKGHQPTIIKLSCRVMFLHFLAESNFVLELLYFFEIKKILQVS